MIIMAPLRWSIPSQGAIKLNFDLQNMKMGSGYGLNKFLVPVKFTNEMERWSNFS